jgi:hypothetical protein
MKGSMSGTTGDSAACSISVVPASAEMATAPILIQ